MSEHQLKEAMRVAAVSKDDFERQVNGPAPPRVAILAKQGTRKRSLPTAPAAGALRAKADDRKNHSRSAPKPSRGRSRSGKAINRPLSKTRSRSIHPCAEHS